LDFCAQLRKPSKDLGMDRGTTNPNTFHDEEFKRVSLARWNPKVRQAAIDHHLDYIYVANETKSRDLKIRSTDGSSFPDRDGARYSEDNLPCALGQNYSRIGEDQRLVPEYKVFEPAFYYTDVHDRGPLPSN
jgi:L-rhamnose isomerase/sugar isomerase